MARLVNEEEDDVEEEEAEPVKVLEEVGSFDKIIVWGHEQVPGEDDIFVRGIEEWIGFAQAMNKYDDGKTEVTT
jgi:ribonuclease H2 subunit C